MYRNSILQFSRIIQVAVAACLALLALPVAGDETGTRTLEPGFRPESDYAAGFLDALDTATVAVYPTIVRRADRTAHSFRSRDQIIAMLEERNIVATVTESRRINLGTLPDTNQWDLFLSDMKRIAEQLENLETDADYSLFMEIILPIDNRTIYGIHCYLLDRQGRNAFSFLLNSHHRLFVDAGLSAGDSSEAARITMTERATQVGVTALEAQIEQARDRAVLAPEGDSTITRAGVFDDFESGLPAGVDSNGIPIGFVTFTNEHSTANISTTVAYPPRPGATDGMNVLQLDLSVTGWAAFAHLFENAAVDRWIAYDWSAFDEISFWLYGNNSGISLFVDILDNRNRYSVSDDAERHVYRFADDFAGWRLITIPFADMVRKEVNNGAPIDGLGLTEVHGWAFGASNTGDQMSFYLDDFTLSSTAGAGQRDDAVIVHRSPAGLVLEETPIDGTSSMIALGDGYTETGSAAGKSLSLMCQCAWVTLEKGFTYFLIEAPRQTTNDSRMRFTIRFYHEPPAGLPVMKLDRPPERGTDPNKSVLRARDWAQGCQLLDGMSGRP